MRRNDLLANAHARSRQWWQRCGHVMLGHTSNWPTSWRGKKIWNSISMNIWSSVIFFETGGSRRCVPHWPKCYFEAMKGVFLKAKDHFEDSDCAFYIFDWYLFVFNHFLPPSGLLIPPHRQRCPCCHFCHPTARISHATKTARSKAEKGNAGRGAGGRSCTGSAPTAYHQSEQPDLKPVSS